LRLILKRLCASQICREEEEEEEEEEEVVVVRVVGGKSLESM